jgi:hypothetical protein
MDFIGRYRALSTEWRNEIMRRIIEIMLVMVLSAAGSAPALNAAHGDRGSRGGSEAPAPEAAQSATSGHKTVTVMPGGLMSPLFITKLVVGKRVMVLGKPISVNQYHSDPALILNNKPFEAGSGWLNDMVLYIKNRTDKTVASATVLLSFPETGNGRTEPICIYHIRLGRIPPQDAFDGRTGSPLRIDPNAKPLNLAPGQDVVVHVADYMNEIKGSVEKAMPLFYVTRVGVSINACTFADGMRYSGGAFSLPDTSQHGKWRYLPSGYFPGNPRQSWPPGL